MKKRISVLLIMALLSMAALGGCAGGTEGSSGDNSSAESQAGNPVYGGSIVVGIQQDVDSLDPHKATAAGTKEILFNIFE
ncbi:MAG: ABC transporter substrate-binding protein, partial [Lachnospiraceae bacterium]|nr:ABC transporter substrate-binding protein [Lachnospiraceae bacterium]